MTYEKYINIYFQLFKKYSTLCGCIINTNIHKYNGDKYNIHIDLLLILLCLENLIPIFVRI